jgi:hypothetical protein
MGHPPKEPLVKKFIICLTSSIVLMSLSATLALAGDVLLTVTDATNPSFKKEYDLKALEALGIAKFTTTTSWTDGDVTFEGVKISDLLASEKLSGTTLKASAINDYSVDVPVNDAEKYPVMIAYRMNGKEMDVRDKGPLWIVYPRADYPELMEEQHNFKWVWQLNAIEIR